MSLNTFFAYFGSKWRSSPIYPPPLHDTIIEPFAGSAGYSMRHHHKRVILVERDAEIAALWRYLLRASVREILALPLLEPGADIDTLTCHAEGRALIGHNLARGNPGKGSKLTTWDLANPGRVWGRTMRARIASQVDKIRHWQIIEGDYTEAPDVEATWFVDPPYVNVPRAYPCGSDAIDFHALASWCRARRGQVMVCEQEGAEWLPFRFLGNVQATPRGRAMVSPEVIWTNDPPAPVLL